MSIANIEGRIIHKTKVDFASRNISPAIELVQYDNVLPVIQVEMFKDDIPFKIPEGYTVKVRWGKPDKTYVYNDILGTNETGTSVYFEITYQMTVLHGDAYPILELSKEGGKKAGSSPMKFTIRRNAIQSGDKESESSNGVIDNAVEAAENARDKAIEAKDATELLASQVVDDRQIVLEAKVATIKAKDESVAAAAGSKTSETNANSSKVAAEKARDESVTAKNASVSASTSAETSKVAAEKARGESVVAKTAAESASSSATASATAAKTSADKAGVDAGKAAASATSASSSSTSAKGYAEDALKSKNEANVSQNAAKTSETNSKTSETNSKASETAANTSKTNAASSASTASTKASEASASAAAAKTSETNSKASETAAKTSENEVKSIINMTYKADGPVNDKFVFILKGVTRRGGNMFNVVVTGNSFNEVETGNSYGGAGGSVFAFIEGYTYTGSDKVINPGAVYYCYNDLTFKMGYTNNDEVVIEIGGFNNNSSVQVTAYGGYLGSTARQNIKIEQSTSSALTKYPIELKSLIHKILVRHDIKDWARASSKPSYTASEVGARPAGNVPWTEVSGKPSFAPANAQKNSDITKSEIEAKLTGDITSHTHSSLTGFIHRDNLSWSTQIGEYLTAWYDAQGGGWGFRTNAPSLGKTSMVIDGTIYINEGRDPVASEKWVAENADKTPSNVMTSDNFSVTGSTLNIVK